MFFPISDDDRDIDSPSFVTYTLLAINIVVFLYQLSNESFTYGWSVIPKEITSGVDLLEPQPVQVAGGGVVQIEQAPGPPIIYLTLITSMFMHGGIGHIVGNMLYLWIFGNNVEHRFGHVCFLLFYLFAGFVASFAQIILDPNSVIPNLGASGAIAGVMGAYLVLFPRNQINAVIFITSSRFQRSWCLACGSQCRWSAALVRLQRPMLRRVASRIWRTSEDSSPESLWLCRSGWDWDRNQTRSCIANTSETRERDSGGSGEGKEIALTVYDSFPLRLFFGNAPAAKSELELAEGRNQHRCSCEAIRNGDRAKDR